jgi:2-dehydropantoate 2-reductase
MRKRIAVVGTGALGGYVGGHLAHQGHDVTLIDMWPEHIETIRARGLELDGITPEEKFTVTQAKTMHITELQSLSKQKPVDIAFVAVKSYDTEWATTNLWGERWTKLCQNGMRNGVSASTGLSGKECDRNDAIRRFSIKLGGEAVRVGQALGYQLVNLGKLAPECLALASEGNQDALVEIENLMMSRAASNPRAGIQRPSMAQDMRKGRRTEIQFMNGFIAEKGRFVGVAAPAHEKLTEIVTRVERGEIPQSPANLGG